MENKKNDKDSVGPLGSAIMEIPKGAYTMTENEQMTYPKTIRLLSLFEKLTKGEVIRKAEEAECFGVDAKSIQRDIDDLRFYFQEYWSDSAALPFSRTAGGYRLNRRFQNELTATEVLVIGKILLESRSLKKPEMSVLLDKLAKVCEPDQRKHIQEVLRNERHHYYPVRQGEDLMNRVWELSRAMRDRRLVELTYGKEQKSRPVCRTVEPVGVIFSEYYFYLVAHIHGQNYPFPAVYRIDRITEHRLLEEKFTFPYTQKFEEGEFRKRIQFMKPGPLITLRFRFWGESPEAALDRFPNGKIIDRTNDDVTIQAEVFGEGVVMWLLSQAQYLEVLEPKSLRETMKQTIEKMRQNYL